MPAHGGNKRKKALRMRRGSSGPPGKQGQKYVSRCPECFTSLQSQGFTAETDVTVTPGKHRLRCPRGHSWDAR